MSAKKQTQTAAEAVQAVKDASGSVLEALLAAQAAEGILTDEALEAAADAYSTTAAKLYETASFYSMFRFAPVGKTVIAICRNAPCHVAGAGETIAAFEEALDISMGETTPDGAFTLQYSECIGQCQASPSVMVNGAVYTGVTADKVPGLLKAVAQ